MTHQSPNRRAYGLAEVIAMVSELGRLALSLRSIKTAEGAPERPRHAIGPIPRAERSYTLDSEVSALLPEAGVKKDQRNERSEEHTSELQSLMRISYAVFGLKKTQDTKHLNH